MYADTVFRLKTLLLSVSDSDFLLTWHCLVGEPPSIRADRNTMIAALLESPGMVQKWASNCSKEAPAEPRVDDPVVTVLAPLETLLPPAGARAASERRGPELAQDGPCRGGDHQSARRIRSPRHRPALRATPNPWRVNPRQGR